MEASKFRNNGRFARFVAKKETNNNSRGRVMECLVFW
jgi:hypothetical protein